MDDCKVIEELSFNDIPNTDTPEAQAEITKAMLEIATFIKLKYDFIYNKYSNKEDQQDEARQRERHLN